MTIWAAVILAIALILAVANLLKSLKTGATNLQDIILFLVALGVLVRIRFKTQEGEKEKLKEEVKYIKNSRKVAATNVGSVKKKTASKKKAVKKRAPAKKKVPPRKRAR